MKEIPNLKPLCHFLYLFYYFGYLLTDGDLFYKRLVNPEITTHTVVAWLKNRTLSQSAQHFLALFREMFLG